MREVERELTGLVARLRASQLPGPAGVRYNHERKAWHWGNAVIGAHNAIAPPMVVVHDEFGRTHADMVLGAAYEGPPGLVHGGVAALFLDHLMGETASGLRRPTFTGTLTLRYRRGHLWGRSTSRADRPRGGPQGLRDREHLRRRGRHRRGGRGVHRAAPGTRAQGAVGA